MHQAGFLVPKKRDGPPKFESNLKGPQGHPREMVNGYGQEQTRPIWIGIAKAAHAWARRDKSGPFGPEETPFFNSGSRAPSGHYQGLQP